MSERLTGKIIVVAGAGGIGDVLAERYVADGARVVLGDIRSDHARSVAQKIDPAGDRIVATSLDGTDEDSIAAAIELARSQFGAPNGMHVNFAASEAPGMGINMPLDEFDMLLRVNIRGSLLCTRQIVPAMLEAGGGALVYTSSSAAYNGSPDRTGYQMCKSAIHALMRSVARAYGPQGIRANVIAPGVILHPGLLRNAPEKELAAVVASTPISTRPGSPADIAQTGSFLLSDEAGYITGQVISVDGGLTMRP